MWFRKQPASPPLNFVVYELDGMIFLTGGAAGERARADLAANNPRALIATFGTDFDGTIILKTLPSPNPRTHTDA